MNQDELLQAFDKEVEDRCMIIKTSAENMCGNLQAYLDLILLGIPEQVRKMPVKQLYDEYDGNLQEAIRRKCKFSNVRNDSDDFYNNISINLPKISKTPEKTKQKDVKVMFRTPTRNSKPINKNS